MLGIDDPTFGTGDGLSSAVGDSFEVPAGGVVVEKLVGANAAGVAGVTIGAATCVALGGVTIGRAGATCTAAATGGGCGGGPTGDGSVWTNGRGVCARTTTAASCVCC